MSNLRSVPPLTLSDRVAEEIRALMARRKMTGKQLAAVLDLPASGLSYRLNGKIPFRVDELEQIADALGVHPAILLGGIPDTPPPTVPTTGRYSRNSGTARNFRATPVVALAVAGSEPKVPVAA